MQRDTVMYVTERGEAERRQSPFEQMERAKRAEAKRRYRETTPGERLESALALGRLAAELRSRARRVTSTSSSRQITRTA
jgi:hypothetical protein